MSEIDAITEVINISLMNLKYNSLKEKMDTINKAKSQLTALLSENKRLTSRVQELEGYIFEIMRSADYEEDKRKLLKNYTCIQCIVKDEVLRAVEKLPIPKSKLTPPTPEKAEPKKPEFKQCPKCGEEMKSEEIIMYNCYNPKCLLRIDKSNTGQALKEV